MATRELVCVQSYNNTGISEKEVSAWNSLYGYSEQRIKNGNVSYFVLIDSEEGLTPYLPGMNAGFDERV